MDRFANLLKLVQLYLLLLPRPLSACSEVLCCFSCAVSTFSHWLAEPSSPPSNPALNQNIIFCNLADNNKLHVHRNTCKQLHEILVTPFQQIVLNGLLKSVPYSNIRCRYICTYVCMYVCLYVRMYVCVLQCICHCLICNLSACLQVSLVLRSMSHLRIRLMLGCTCVGRLDPTAITYSPTR